MSLTRWRVSWVREVVAENPREAAVQALREQNAAVEMVLTVQSIVTKDVADVTFSRNRPHLN